MATTEVPPWGCPWHGLVRDTTLSLPNGGSVAWAWNNTLNVEYQRSTSMLLAVPGMPQVERPEEEAQIDEQSGRQWWNVAVVGGGMLHGTSLGRNGWIYLDPDNRPWRVRATFTPGGGLPSSVSLSVERFGVPGGAPVSFTYDTLLPDLGQPSSGPHVTGVCLHHVRHDGRAAIFMLYHIEADSSARRGMSPWAFPLGFFEVQLAGPADELEVEPRVLRTREQTIAEPTSTLPELAVSEWELVYEGETVYEGAGFPDCTGTYTRTTHLTAQSPPPNPSTPQNVSFASGEGNGSVTHPGYVVSLYYDQDGQIHELSACMEMTYSINVGTPIIVEEQPRIVVSSATAGLDACRVFSTISEQPGKWRLEMRSSLNGSARQSIKLDGVEVAARVIPFSEAVWFGSVFGSAVWDLPIPVPFSQSPYHITRTWLDGAEELWGTTTTNLNGWPQRRDPVVPTVYQRGPVLLREPVSFSALTGGAGDFRRTAYAYCITQHSALCFGFGYAELYARPFAPINSFTSYTLAPEVVTPAGVANVPHDGLVSRSGNPGELVLYGSWCPVTGQVARDTVPVFWV